QPAALQLGEFRSVCALDKFRYEINDTIVRAAIDELDDVLVFQRSSDVDLAHEAAHRFIADRKLRQQSLDSDGASSTLLATQHHCSHSTATQESHCVVTGNRLRRSLEFDTTVFTQKSQMLVGCGGLCLFP